MFSLWSLVDKTQIWLVNVEAVLHCDRQKSVGKLYHQWNGHSVTVLVCILCSVWHLHLSISRGTTLLAAVVKPKVQTSESSEGEITFEYDQKLETDDLYIFESTESLDHSTMIKNYIG